MKKQNLNLICAFLLFSFSQFANAFGLGFGAGSPAPSFVSLMGRQEFGSKIDLAAGIGYSSYSDLSIIAISPQLRFFPAGERTDLVGFWVGGGVNFLMFEGQGDLQNLEIDTESALPLLLLNLGLDLRAPEKITWTVGAQFHFPVKLIFPLVEFSYNFD